jgi:hypothetical protein
LISPFGLLTFPLIVVVQQLHVLFCLASVLSGGSNNVLSAAYLAGAETTTNSDLIFRTLDSVRSTLTLALTLSRIAIWSSLQAFLILGSLMLRVI